jgi:hypothetical protein
MWRNTTTTNPQRHTPADRRGRGNGRQIEFASHTGLTLNGQLQFGLMQANILKVGEGRYRRCLDNYVGLAEKSQIGATANKDGEACYRPDQIACNEEPNDRAGHSNSSRQESHSSAVKQQELPRAHEHCSREARQLFQSVRKTHL